MSEPVKRWRFLWFAAIVAVGYTLGLSRYEAHAQSGTHPCYCCRDIVNAFAGWTSSYDSGDGVINVVSGDGLASIAFYPGTLMWYAGVDGVGYNHASSPSEAKFCLQTVAHAMTNAKSGTGEPTWHASMGIIPHPGDFEQCCCSYCPGGEECGGCDPLIIGCGSNSCGWIWNSDIESWVQEYDFCSGETGCECRSPTGCPGEGEPTTIDLPCGATTGGDFGSCEGGGGPGGGGDGSLPAGCDMVRCDSVWDDVWCAICSCATSGGDTDGDGCCDAWDSDPDVAADPPHDPYCFDCSSFGGDSDSDGCCDNWDEDDGDPMKCRSCDARQGDYDEDGCCADIDENDYDPNVCRGCRARCRWERDSPTSSWSKVADGCERPPQDDCSGMPACASGYRRDPYCRCVDVDGNIQGGGHIDDDPREYECPPPPVGGVATIAYTDCKCPGPDCACDSILGPHITAMRDKVAAYVPDLADVDEVLPADVTIYIPNPLNSSAPWIVEIPAAPAAWPYVGSSLVTVSTFVLVWFRLCLVCLVVKWIIHDVEAF